MDNKKVARGAVIPVIPSCPAPRLMIRGDGTLTARGSNVSPTVTVWTRRHLPSRRKVLPPLILCRDDANDGSSGTPSVVRRAP